VNWELTLKGFDFLTMFGIVVFGNLFSIWLIRYRDRVLKRKMMEDFLSHIQEKIQTEEEFQEIIDRMRRDFDGNNG
jgi:RNA binding exosome subunit